METVNLNKNWTFCKLDSQGNPIFSKKIDIPHDAMIFEKRSENAPGGLNVSFFEGGDYIYSRDIEISNDDLNKNLYLEFEGIYHNGEIYLNDKLVYKRPYGYADFFVDITSFVHVGINKLKVKVINSDQPNSRWYSGSGIYRPVSLIKIDKENSILLNGVKIKTTSINPVTCSINVKTIGNGTITVSIFDEDKRIAIKSKKATGDDTLEINLDDKKIVLWDEDHPKLYRIKVEFNNDSQVFDYGFRLIEYNENGLFLNGKRLLIKGACIHHDNGPLGAIDDDFANRRKIKLLKDIGYNALRSAHNPISKSLIKACDELGMMILDELVDCWIIHKTLYDYVNLFDEWHEIDLLDMVNKDYNHPSVIMYSTGNEVGETSMKRGIELTKEMTDYLHALDDTRPVTCGINIFFNFLASMGFGVYSDKKAEKYSSKQGEKKRKKVGSEFFNAIAGKLGASFMKTMATLVFCDYKTKDAFKNMDIAGYNYGIKRYKHDLRKYKSRLILGSETFCNDAYKFMELAKDNPRLVGDFVWAGMDYMGEVAVGSWVHRDHTNTFSPSVGWITAGSGRIDITGRELSEAKYTRVAFDKDPIHIGIVPVNYHKDKHSPSAWKMNECIDSYTYPGYENKKTLVEVYSKADYVTLKINGETIKTKKRPKKDCIVRFKIKYQPGIIEAIGLDKNHNELYKTSLKTANLDEICLRAYKEKDSVNLDELAYVRFKYSDSNGIYNPLARDIIEITNLKNGTLEGLAMACPFNEIGYKDTKTDTYLGEALGIFKPDGKGDISFDAVSKKYGTVHVVIPFIK